MLRHSATAKNGTTAATDASNAFASMWRIFDRSLLGVSFEIERFMLFQAFRLSTKSCSIIQRSSQICSSFTTCIFKSKASCTR